MDVTIQGGFFKGKIVEQYGSVTNFAGVVGVSRAYIYGMINGVEKPSLERVAQFAELLNTTIDDLVSVEIPKEAALATM